MSNSPSIENRYINREISWLQFNQRVLEEAQNTQLPLLERLKFLSITGSNLDEFISVRYAGILRQEMAGLKKTSLDGLTPQQQRVLLHQKLQEFSAQQQETTRMLFADFAKNGIVFEAAETLDTEDTDWLFAYCQQHVLPHLHHTDDSSLLPHNGMTFVIHQATRITHYHLPKNMQRFIHLPARHTTRKTLVQHTRFVLLDDALLAFFHQQHPEADYIGVHVLLRDAVLDLPEEAEDLLVSLSTQLKQRQLGPVIAIFYRSYRMQPPPSLVVQSLSNQSPMLIAASHMLRLSDGFTFYALSQNDRYVHWRQHCFMEHVPRFPERINDFGGDILTAIAAKDIVVHHPYESFEVVVSFLRQAANDPFVSDIYQTLYRTSNDSPIVHALMHAARQGKHVVVVVEVKARFDEAANLRWGKDLEEAGAHVIYSVAGYKTHAKLTLVLRQEKDHTMHYCHVGTGNYHSEAARVYSDVSFFTANAEIAQDMEQVFTYFAEHTPNTPLPQCSTLRLAPNDLRPALLAYIDAEITHARAGQPATIWMKMNALVDTEIIEKLYDASQAGVQITLIVRGICCLRAGVEGVSENITVKSIVGRFLEHARIYAFGNGEALPSPQAHVLMSSADMMPRNLDRRIECLLPITTPTIHEQLLGQILEANVKDTLQSWEMQPDGRYIRTTEHRLSTAFSAHQFFLSNPSLSGRGTALRIEQSTALERNKPNSKIAVIDIGSNSIRLVIYDGLKRVSLPLFNEKVMCGLARDMQQTGKLHVKGSKAALDAIERFVRITRDLQVSDVIAFATAAVREAKDGKKFTQKILQRFGVRVHIISGALEAKYGALGVLASVHEPQGLVCDLGGGSLELIEIEQQAQGRMQLQNPSSLTLGALRLQSIAASGNKKKDKMALAQAAIEKALADYPLNPQAQLYLIGGSFRAIGKMHMEAQHYPYQIIHEYEADSASLHTLLYQLTHHNRRQLQAMPGMSKKRLDHMPYAALCLSLLLERSEATRVIFSAHGVREGVLYDRLPYPIQQQKALMQASLDMVSYLLPEPLPQWHHFAQALYHWLTPLFRTEDSHISHLRQVACILSRIAWHEHKANRAEIAYRWMLDVELPALSHPHRVFLAVILFYRNQTSDPKRITKDAHFLLSSEDVFRAQVIGTAMRVGLRLSAGSTQVLKQVRLQQKAKKLQVTLAKDAPIYLNEETQTRLEKLSHLMGLKLEII